MTALRCLALGVAVLAAAVSAAPGPAHAQPAEAIGRPLPDASLRDGTVMVRLIAGDRSKPVSDAEVTITISSQDGSGTPTEKRARTDADGRATFVDVPDGMRVRISAPGDDGVVTATPFPMPMTGGVRVMVSTAKMAGGGPAMGGPMMGGGQMPAPRQMSGQPRPEANDDGDQLTVRLTYDDFADPTPPKDHPVVLVAYRWDQTFSAQVVRTDAGGRAVFRGLNRSGSISYFAMTMLPRGAGFDRLISTPIVMPGDTGVRVMLSGEKRAVETPVDDLGKVDPGAGVAVPGGEVRVNLIGYVEPQMVIELVDATSGEVIAKTQPTAPEVDETGKPRGNASARFTGVTAGGLDRAFVVRAAHKLTYLSAPFQLTAGRGAGVTVFALPRVMLQFSLSSWIDDIYLGVRGQFQIMNTSLAPYVAGTKDKPEEVVVALPKGFKGATVHQNFAEHVGVDPTRGFIIRRPLPPGPTSFIGAFSLVHEHGKLTWDMPLPLGVFDSGMEIRRDGTGRSMVIRNVPPDVSVREANAQGSAFYVLEPITIEPGKRMVFTVEGLPQAPAWSRWSKIGAGLLVLVILGVGIAAVMAKQGPPAVSPRARFDQLLDELAALEAAGGGGARRDQIMAELEELHRKGAAG